jgi:hypothetical protein
LPVLALGIAEAALPTGPALAVPITYTEDATATGSLGGVAFTDAMVTLTMINDTTNVTNPSPGLFLNIGTATVSVNGDTPVAFTDSIAVFSNQTVSVGGFADVSFATPLDILDTTNAAFAAYDLKSFIGPLSGSPANIDFNVSFPTADGAFILTALAGPASTFTATATPGVPEPGMLSLFGAALAGLGLIRRRKTG